MRAMRIGPERDYPEQADPSPRALDLVGTAGGTLPGLANREMS
jgi:hypothetical protein